MSNVETMFITQRVGQYGSSLYKITPKWVLRCSGNNSGADRESTTFIRKRAIKYEKKGKTFQNPAIGLSPVEGGHTGNPIVLIINSLDPKKRPNCWKEINGMPWVVAVSDINEAYKHTKDHPNVTRAKRECINDYEFVAD